MSITTYSKFYYGITISEDNCKMDFDEGGGELTATLEYGTYTPEEIADEVAAQLNATGSFTYTCTFDRSNRKLTITSSSSVEMLFLSGSNAAESAYETLGFSTAADVTNTTFTAASVLGSQYLPQFILQSYVPVENFIEQQNATVNETVTGRQELITFGDTYMTRFNITMCTDISQPSDGPIISNASGVAAVTDFLYWLTKKNKVEFMPNANASGYINLVLDASVASKNGTTMRLKELYDKGLCGYYETELLTFRKVD